VTDKLASYIKPCTAALPLTPHIRDKGQNNRAENSHQPTRQRERRMRGFKSAAQAQRFLSIFNEISNLFAFARHTVSATNFRVLLTRRLAAWRALTLPERLT
jgi:putative transposase